MPLSDALTMPVSFESDYYKSEGWNQRKSAIEYSDTMQRALLHRLDNLVGGRR